MEGGWVQVEMANLTNYVAKLIENEFSRFTALFSIITGHAISEDVDLQDLVKRL